MDNKELETKIKETILAIAKEPKNIENYHVWQIYTGWIPNLTT